MYFKVYHTLPKEAAELREAVFIREQGFSNEFDEIDRRAVHIVLFDESGLAIAVCRYFWSEEKGCYVLGRLAVAKPWRAKHLGSAVLAEAERQLRAKGETSLMLAAQLNAKPFYEKQGYRPVGDIFFDEYCPHIWMRKQLEVQA